MIDQKRNLVAFLYQPLRYDDTEIEFMATNEDVHLALPERQASRVAAEGIRTQKSLIPKS
jgi:hypothetical protein